MGSNPIEGSLSRIVDEFVLVIFSKETDEYG